jgi:maleylpyruvate isomerase
MNDLRELVEAHTERLLLTARALDDVAAASLCTGWSRGHILTHIARNADGIAAMVRAGLDDSGETMYASNERRDADIEDGASRPLADLVADVETTARTVADQLRRLRPQDDDTRVERTPGGMRIRLANLPRMRLREVVYHHVDLAAGFSFADVDPDLLHLFLDGELRTLGSVAPELGLTVHTDEGERFSPADGGAFVEGPAAGVLLWLARGDASGVRSERLPELPAGR